MVNTLRANRTLFILITILSVFLGGARSGMAADALLGVPETAQEHSQWCWAGSSKAVLDYYGAAVTQCEIANYAWGRSDCCGNSTFKWNSVCNEPNSMYGASGSLQDILTNWGVASTARADCLSRPEFVSQIDSVMPFVMRFGWTSGGGHFLDGYGYHQDGQYMDYMDPWPGNGYTRSLYTWVVSSSDHDWTHTLQVTTQISAVPALTLSVLGNGTGSVSWSGKTCSAGTCTYTYQPGTALTLTAKAGSGSVLTGWTGCAASSGNTCDVTMSDDVAVSATFIKPPRISVSPASINFGTVKTGESYSKAVTLKNTGVTDLVVSYEISGTNSTEFSASGCTDPVATGESCTITVELAPVLPFDTKSAQLHISSNDPKKPSVNVKLSANAKAPRISVSPASLNFGRVTIGTDPAPSKTVTIRNTGVSDLSITSFSDPADTAFRVAQGAGCAGPLQNPGGTCVLTVTFDPSDTVLKRDEIDITSNATATPVKIKLTGQGK